MMGAGEWKRGGVRIIGGNSCDDISSASWLRCPACGDEYLHQGAVHCWDRFVDEIGAKGTHLTVGTHSVSFDTDQSENPSNRRHGVAIDFHCERCDDAYEMQLVLSQHKGITETYWRYRVNPDSEMWRDDSQEVDK